MKSELPKILAVDDFGTNLTNIRLILSQLDAEVIEARSGVEALGLMLQHDFAVILLDVNMPEMDGFELAKIVRSTNNTRHVPIIFVSASVNDPDHRRKGYESGAVDFIQKPVEADILISKVKIFTGMYRQKRELELLHGKLERSSTDLQHTQRLSRVGGWAINLETNSYTISDNALDVFFPNSRSDLAATGPVEAFISLLPETERAKIVRTIERASDSQMPEVEFELELLDNEQCPRIASSIASLIYKDDKLVEIRGSVQDITERRGAEEKLQYAATHDALTGLPNRYLFRDRLDQAFFTAERAGDSVAVLLIDLDHFKEINDTLGHPTGDALLIEVGKRLSLVARANDTVARLGGDEFAVICTELADVGDIGVFTQRCIDALAREFEIGDETVRSGCSIGISCYPSDGCVADELIKYADLALYQSKAEGRGVFHLYNDDMSAKVKLKREKEDRLYEALQRDEFELYFQPKIDLKTGRTVGAEGLARWNHPTEGVIFPGDFIEQAEATGFIHELGAGVIRKACRAAARWHDIDRARFRIAVNISTLQMRSIGFVDQVRQIMVEEKAPRDILEFEITEGAILSDPEKMGVTLDELRFMGISIALDDFGSGYSSLTHLKYLRASTLKIDQSFIGNILDDQYDLHIARKMIELAHDLQMKVVAEGVETEDQMGYLRDWGCDMIQGYLVSQPLPERDFLRWLEEHKGGWQSSRDQKVIAAK